MYHCKNWNNWIVLKKTWLLGPVHYISPTFECSHCHNNHLQPHRAISRNLFDFCIVPLLITQRAYSACFQPSLYAIEVKYMTAITKGDTKSVFIIGRGVCLMIQYPTNKLCAYSSFTGSIFTWYSIDGSLRLFLQIAQVSAQISQDHIATALHFLISKCGAAGLLSATTSPPPAQAFSSAIVENI